MPSPRDWFALDWCSLLILLICALGQSGSVSEWGDRQHLCVILQFRGAHSALLLLSSCFGVGCSCVPMFPCAGNYLHMFLSMFLGLVECPLFIRQMETKAGKHSNEFYDMFSKRFVIECHRNVCQKKVKGGKCHQGRYFPDERWLCLPSCLCCLRKADAVKSPASLVFCSALLSVLCGFWNLNKAEFWPESQLCGDKDSIKPQYKAIIDWFTRDPRFSSEPSLQNTWCQREISWWE